MIPLCGRTKLGGGKCAAVALKGKSFCYFHDPHRQHRVKAVKVRYFLEITMLEPGVALRVALSETAQAIARNEIDCGYAGRLLYALQLALNGERRGTPPAKPASPRYIKIARTPGHPRIYSTSNRPPTSQPS